jgi:hypothetical protein
MRYFEYKVGDQVLLEEPGILPKPSTLCTVPYPEIQVYKNGTVQIQRRNESTKVNIFWSNIETLRICIILGANDILLK